MNKKTSRDSILFWLSVFVLLGMTTIFGIYDKSGPMLFMIVAGAVGIAFANLDKFKWIKASVFEGELRDRFLKTEKKTDELETMVLPVIDKETELEESETEKFGLQLEAYATGEEDKLVIKALGSSKYSRRTLDGIKKETKLDKDKILKTMRWLDLHRLAASSGAEAKYWSLTYKGRDVFRHSLID